MTTIIEELWFKTEPDATPDSAAASSFAARVAQSEGLKTFPMVAQKILSAFSDTEFKAKQISHFLEEDPAMASGVLRVANSVFFSPPRPITEIEQAFVRIGVSHTKEIVCAVATMEMFADTNRTGMLVRDHCAAVAGIADHLGKVYTRKKWEGLFLAGLLHDIGKPMLMDSREMDYPGDGASPTPPDTMHLLERRRLGYDHAVLAGHVVSSWHFGETVSKIIAWHHQPERAFEDADISVPVALLRFADQVDFLLTLGGDDYVRDVQLLAKTEEAKRIGIDEDTLQQCWPELRNVQEEALSVFAVRH